MRRLLRPPLGAAWLVAFRRRIPDAGAFEDAECLRNVGPGSALREVSFRALTASRLPPQCALLSVMTQVQSIDERPIIPVPQPIAGLIASADKRLGPLQYWLFGSRARGKHHPDSDWDVLAVLPDEAPDSALDPLVAWEIARESGISSTLLTTRLSDLQSIWGCPNSLGYILATEGVRLAKPR